jgi:hypothetical protein
MAAFPSLGPAGGSGGPTFLTGWDRLDVGNITLPGKWKITAGGIKLKADPKSKAGVHGANPAFHGLDPLPFDAEGFFWTDDQLAQLLVVLPQMLPQPGQQPKVYYVSHADILHLGVAVNMAFVGAGPLEREGRGGRKLKIHMLHWLPATSPKNQKATATPKSAVKNLRAEAAAKRNPPNPEPTTQPGIAGPPPGLRSGQ